jgi:hypothetical protein
MKVVEYDIQGTLYFLQSEFRRFEEERCEWKTETAELKAKIALLEAEKCKSDFLEADLKRRVQMLELALRKERFIYGNQGCKKQKLTTLYSPKTRTCLF